MASQPPRVALAAFRTSAVNGYRLLLRYPASWHRYDWRVVSSFTNGMAYLSTGREHDPCKTTHTSDSTEIACGPPLQGLAPGGLLLTWTSIAFPEPAGRKPLSGLPGRLVRLPSGWLEKVSRDAGGTCSGIGTSASVTADFARPTTHGVRYEMEACFRAPGVATHTHQVLAMLHELRFVPP